MLTSAQTTPDGQVSSGCFNKTWYEANNDSCPDIPSDPKHIYKDKKEFRDLITQYCMVCPFNCKGGKERPSIDEHVKATCMKKPGCTKRFIARYGCTALPDTGVTALPSRCPFVGGDYDTDDDC